MRAGAHQDAIVADERLAVLDPANLAVGDADCRRAIEFIAKYTSTKCQSPL